MDEPIEQGGGHLVSLKTVTPSPKDRLVVIKLVFSQSWLIRRKRSAPPEERNGNSRPFTASSPAQATTLIFLIALKGFTFRG